MITPRSCAFTKLSTSVFCIQVSIHVILTILTFDLHYDMQTAVILLELISSKRHQTTTPKDFNTFKSSQELQPAGAELYMAGPNASVAQPLASLPPLPSTAEANQPMASSVVSEVGMGGGVAKAVSTARTAGMQWSVHSNPIWKKNHMNPEPAWYLSVISNMVHPESASQQAR